MKVLLLVPLSLLTLVVSAVTPERYRWLVPDGRPSLRSLTTTRDIEDGGGFLAGLLVRDQMGRAGEDQGFSRRTPRIGSQNVYTTAVLESPLSGGLHPGSAGGAAL
jgi:hypothetical protein